MPLVHLALSAVALFAAMMLGRCLMLVIIRSIQWSVSENTWKEYITVPVVNQKTNRWEMVQGLSRGSLATFFRGPNPIEPWEYSTGSCSPYATYRRWESLLLLAAAIGFALLYLYLMPSPDTWFR